MITDAKGHLKGVPKKPGKPTFFSSLQCRFYHPKKRDTSIVVICDV